MTQLKLYTKEMFIKSAEKCEVSMIDAEHIMKYIDEYVTAIELPSDEEIEQAIIDEDMVRQHGYCHCFLEGAKWMKEQILKNK